MTVAELIEVLKKYDESLEVSAYTGMHSVYVNIDESGIYFDEVLDTVVIGDWSRS